MCFVAEQLVQKYQKWPEILDRIFQLQKAKLGTEEERFRGAIQKFLDIDDLTKSADALWTYLYYAGFLTAIPHKGQGFEHPGNIVVDFFIPNEEVLLAWKIFFDEAMFENGEGSTIRRRSLDVMERLAVGQLDKMARLIKEAWRSFSIWNEPQFADGTGKERDSWYHRLLSMFFSTYVDGPFYCFVSPDGKRRGGRCLAALPDAGLILSDCSGIQAVVQGRHTDRKARRDAGV